MDYQQQKVKIAFLLPSLASKGPIHVAKNIIDQLVNHGHTVKVFYFDDIHELQFNCDTEQIGFLDFHKIQGFRILHTHGIRPDLFVFINKQFLKSTICISTLHSYIPDEFKINYGSLNAKFLFFLWNLFLTRHHGIITLSNHMREYYKKILFNPNLFFAYNSVNIPNCNEDCFDKACVEKVQEIKQKYTLLGSVAFVLERKGLHQIIDLLALNKNYAFLMVGDGPYLKNLISYAKSKNVLERCIFLGHQLNASCWLKFMDAYLMTSYSEGFPIATLEAGISKIPIVVSDLPIFTEFFTNEEVTVFNLHNINSLNTAVYNSLKLKDYKIEKCYKKISENYLPINSYQKHLEIYEYILKSSLRTNY